MPTGFNDPGAFVKFLTPGVSYNYGLNYTSGVDPTSLGMPAIQSYVNNETPNFGYTDVMNQRLTYAKDTVIKDAAGNTVATVNPDTAGGRNILQSLGLVWQKGVDLATNSPLSPIPTPLAGFLKNPTPSGVANLLTLNAVAIVVGIILLAIGAYSLVTSQSFARGISNVKGVAALGAA